MKKNYLSLLLAGILFISGCETIGGSSTSSDSPSYEYGDSKQANLQAYLQNEKKLSIITISRNSIHFRM